MAKSAIVTDYDDAGFPAAAAFTSSLTATGAVKTAPGRLLKMVITTALSAAVTVYDNTAASGTILFITAATPAAGTVYDINLPAVNGIFASFAGTGTITFGYA